MSTRVPVTMPFLRERLRSHAPAMNFGDSVWKLPENEQPSLAVPRRAAVAAVLRDAREGPEVLLIRRAEHPADPWSGHMAFPGGREDPTDPDLRATAVRETREELGLDLNAHAELLGQLDPLPAVARGRRTGLMIAPFVFELQREVTLVPNYEVAEALWAPLAPLLRGERLTKIPYVFEGKPMELPAHNLEGRIVWGLTYRMLESLFSLLK